MTCRGISPPASSGVSTSVDSRGRTRLSNTALANRQTGKTQAPIPGGGPESGGNGSFSAGPSNTALPTSHRQTDDDAAYPPLLDHLRKSCGRATFEEVSGICVRARDCRDATCRICAGCRASKRASQAERVVRTFKRWQFWTFTVDAGQFAGDMCRLFIWLKKRRAVAESMRVMQAAGWVGRYCCVLEFTEQGALHFHLIVEALQGYVPHSRMHEAWNRHRPTWAGDVPRFTEGEKAGEDRPPLGYVQYEKPKGEKAVVRYLCGYMAKAGKHDEPVWFRQLRNGQVDGKQHNAVLFSASRGRYDFWAGVRKVTPRREPVKRGRRNKRRTVEERHSDCRVPADVMLRRDLLRDGEIINSKYEYLGSLSAEAGYRATAVALLGEVGEQIGRKAGFWISDDQLQWLLQSKSFASSLQGFGSVERRQIVEREETEIDLREVMWKADKTIDEWIEQLRGSPPKAAGRTDVGYRGEGNDGRTDGREATHSADVAGAVPRRLVG